MQGIITAVVYNNRGLERTSLDALFYGTSSRSENDHKLISWEYVDSDEKMDTFSITIENDSLELFDLDIFQKGNLIEFSFGYPGQLSPPRTGIINGRTGWREMTIMGHMKDEADAHFANASQKFENKTASQIASDLFKEIGLQPVVDRTETKYEVKTRTNETIIKFLKRIAEDEQEDYSVYISSGKGYFVKKPYDKKPILILSETDGQETVGEPNFSDEQGNTSVQTTARSMDFDNGKVIEKTGDNAKSKQTSLGKGTLYFDQSIGRYQRRASNKTAETGNVVISGKTNETELENVAQGDFDKKNSKSSSISWPLFGNPKLEAKNLAQIDCGSREISNTQWYIKEARHSCNVGDYTTTLELIRNASGLTGGNAVAATPNAKTNTEKADQEQQNEVRREFSVSKGRFVPA